MRIYQLIGMVCLGLLVSNTFAQQTLPELKRKDTIKVNFPCYDTKELFKSIRENYDEVPFIFGKSDDVAESTFSMWMSPVNKTFTLIATIEDYSCVVGSGHDFKIVPKDLALKK